MAKPLDTALYERVKKEADEKFDKPSAYKSGWIVNTYKDRDVEYTGNENYSNSTLYTLT